MSILSFLHKKMKTVSSRDQVPDSVDKSGWTGGEFYLLISGASPIDRIDYDQLMTPKNFDWTRVSQIQWPIYKVGEDEYSFSFEKQGIELTFNKAIRFDKAKQIGEEIVEKISSTGQIVHLQVLAMPSVYLKQV